MRIDVLTLFPGMFGGFLDEGLLRIAREKGLVDVRLHDIRAWSEDTRHRKVDDRPYGGGPGMVMAPGPVYRAVEAVLGRTVGPGEPPLRATHPGLRAVLLTPQGARHDQARLRDLAAAGTERLAVVCGRYEGYDERIRVGFGAVGVEEVSVGDYVLSGGEPAAMVLVDGVVRLVPGVLGVEESPSEESFGPGLEAEGGGGPRLEYPQYTRPPSFRGMAVPDVLLSGDHAAIRRWRMSHSMARTVEPRPDLLGRE